MGEYAEMMLDGTCCSMCGEFMNIGGMMDGSFTEPGYPDLCAACKAEERRQPRIPRMQRYGKANPKIAQPSDPIRQGDKMACPFCVRKVKRAGFGDHMLAQHRDKWIIPGDAAQTTEGK